MINQLEGPRGIASSRLGLYDDDNNDDDDNDRRETDSDSRYGFSNSVISNLGVRTLDIAPDVDEDYHSGEKRTSTSSAENSFEYEQTGHTTDRKKKYAKEAWPGRHPSAQLPTSSSSSSSSTLSASTVTAAPPVLASLVAPSTLSLPPAPKASSGTNKRLLI